MIRFIACLSFSVLFVSCAVQKTELTNKNPLNALVNTELNKNHEVGFVLKDLSDGKIVYEKNSHKNFTGASNVKLLNLFTGLNLVKDSIATFEYLVKGDSLILWPMGDPTFLHPSFKNQPAFDFLKNSGKNIFIVKGRYLGNKYGKGWAWDDYNESFQAEITDFPIYANMITCAVDGDGVLTMSPDLSSLYFNEIRKDKSLSIVKRDLYNNNLAVPDQLKPGYKQRIPLMFNSNLRENLLTDTLLSTGLSTTSVVTLPWVPVNKSAKKLYNTSTLDAFKVMLKESDNFIAEQLMLNYAVTNNLPMKTEEAIKEGTKLLSNDVAADSFVWADGSGLSRLNMINPGLMVNVLEKIRTTVNDDDKLFSLLSIGGNDGTLKNMFSTVNTPFIYAKSGSLSNNYNLSGYLVAKSGKKYAFSYLNNNFIAAQSQVKSEIEKTLIYIYENY